MAHRDERERERETKFETSLGFPRLLQLFLFLLFLLSVMCDWALFVCLFKGELAPLDRANFHPLSFFELFEACLLISLFFLIL